MLKFVEQLDDVDNKWLIRIVLRDLKIGFSEKVILGAFHRDAVDMYNVCSDLKQVCAVLKDPSQRYGSNVRAATRPAARARARARLTRAGCAGHPPLPALPAYALRPRRGRADAGLHGQPPVRRGAEAGRRAAAGWARSAQAGAC